MKSFCIIGLGKFGRNLATLLYKNGAHVTVVDRNPDIINAISDNVTTAIVAEPTNEEVLKRIGVTNFDCVILGMVSNVNDCIMLTLMCKELGVRHVIARAADEKHKRVLEKIGADRIIFPELDTAEKLSRSLTIPNVIEYIEYSDDYSIAEIPVPKSWVGKSLLQLDVRKKYDVTVISCRHDGSLEISPSPNTPFAAGDTVSVLGRNDRLTKLADIL